MNSIVNVSKVLVLIFILNFVPPGRLDAGPIIVGGGAGGSEFSIIFARTNLHQMLSDCLSVSCGFSPTEAKDFLPLLDRTSAMPLAIFKTSSELGSRVYETKSKEVWFNKDLLWLDVAHKVSLEVSDAAKLWLEILNSDQVVSTSDLVKLQMLFSSSLKIEKSEQAYGPDSFRITLWQVSSTMDRLYVSSGPDDTTELTAVLIAALRCSDLRALKIQSPSWTSATPTPTQDKPDKIILKLSLNVNWNCGGREHSGFGAAIISAIKNSSEALRFDPQSLDLFVGQQ